MEIHGGQLSLAHPSVDAVGFAKTSFNPKRGNTLCQGYATVRASGIGSNALGKWLAGYYLAEICFY